MKIQDLLGNASDAIQTKRAYGEPIHADGVIVIPAAKVGGGGGGGEGTQPDGKGEGSGGGFGLGARPIGAFVIRPDGKVDWRPTVDLDRLVLLATVALVSALHTLRVLEKMRRSSR